MNTSSNRSTRRGRQAHGVARGLGWFSIGLGLAELLAARPMARGTGLRGDERVLQAYGLREIATGAALLLAKDPTPYVWARVAGDVLDLATLGTRGSPKRLGTAAALAAVAGVTLLDLATARTLQHDRARARRPLHDYSDRRGFPLPADEMRGAALEDFEAPQDMRTPAALAGYSGA
jgi:hypothetical protein